MNNTPMTRVQRRSLERVAKSLVESCVRNALEDVHAANYSDNELLTAHAITAACTARGWLLPARDQ
jgi:hypothetical protein